MALEKQSKILLSAIEAELKKQSARLDQTLTRPFLEMLTYHMGWSADGAKSEAQGKRIRPLLLLLSTAACAGGDWLRAVPAAAAVELIHNFSLVHDDIQDHSEKRHGRPTAWKIWGAPMAINLGDALFVLSNLALLDLSGDYPPDIILRATEILQSTCFDLTSGQFLDMAFENETNVSIEDYWTMIDGKTAALISGSTGLGALLGGADREQLEQFQIFGRDLGLAFQVQDDILGIWGNEALTGKSAASDLVARKKSLPVVYGLNRSKKFKTRWAAQIKSEEVRDIAQLLTEEGAYEFSKQEENRLTHQALDALQNAKPRGEAADSLLDLANKLLNRDS